MAAKAKYRAVERAPSVQQRLSPTVIRDGEHASVHLQSIVMARENAASRILAIALKVPQQNTGLAVLDGWAAVFGVSLADSARGQEVARLLGLLNHQVEAVRTELEARGFDHDAYAGALGRVSNSLALTSLGSQWNWVTQQYSPEVIVALRLFPGILPDEESVEIDEMAQVRAYLAELRTRVVKGQLPSPVRAFLLRQISLIEDGLRDYIVRGVAALTAASEQAAFEWLREGHVVAIYKDNEIVQEVGTLWPRAQSFMKKAAVIGAFAGTLLGGIDKALHIARDLHLLPSAAVDGGLPPTLPESESVGPHTEV